MLFVLAQEAAQQEGPGLLGSMIPILLMFAVIWFVLIRPQQKQEKQRQARVAAIKKGDKVRTRGGVVAPVLKVRDDEIVLGVGGDRSVELPVHKAYVEEVYAADKDDEGK